MSLRLYHIMCMKIVYLSPVQPSFLRKFYGLSIAKHLYGAEGNHVVTLYSLIFRKQEKTEIFAQDIPIIPSSVHINLSSDAISSYSDCDDSCNACESILQDNISSLISLDDEIDTDYDVLSLFGVTSAKILNCSSPHPSQLPCSSQTISFDTLSGQHFSSDITDQEPFTENTNPIYSHIYDSSIDNADLYIPCIDGYNKSMNSKQNSTVPPVSSSCINIISNFEYLGDTYNDIQELGIVSRLSNGFREQIHQSLGTVSDIFETENTNIYMHSDSITTPVLLDSFEPIEQPKSHLSALQNFSDYVNFHFVYYVLLPNFQVIQELIDVRTTPKALILKLGQSLGWLLFINLYLF